jgi:hypothetical protein
MRYKKQRVPPAAARLYGKVEKFKEGMENWRGCNCSHANYLKKNHVNNQRLLINTGVKVITIL